MAVVPPYAEERREIRMFCRLASCAGDEEAELVAAGEVERRRVLQLGVDLVPVGRAHAQPAVLDLHREALAHDAAGDRHRCLRRRVDGRVLGQFGDHVDDIADRGPGQRGLRGRRDLDPGVVLHLGDRRPEDVHQRHRVAPAARGCLTGRDDEALGVPAHARREMVHPEQVVELLRIPGPSFHGVQQRQLPVQERLAAPGQVTEDVADALAELGLPDGRLHRRPLHRGEGLADLADLIEVAQ